LENAARIAAGKGGGTTLFQPGLMVRSILNEDTGDLAGEVRPAPTPSDVTGDDTRLAAADPTPPPLQLEVEPYFLVLGAPPGKERIALNAARTTFGRARADVVLADDTISGPHFQVDVMGREFFVRDLDSRNGTRLNGHPVRYSELMPGDELRIGETVLVFRTSGDGVGERKS
jgi:pSer/pThr/pTyr-binding forkhead associated (FHA) protein